MGNIGETLTTLGNAGGFALVAWLVRHTFAHTIPRLAKDFRDSIDEQRKEFLGELRRINEEGREERRECVERMNSLTQEMALLRHTVEKG
jgi:hypothetical protein